MHNSRHYINSIYQSHTFVINPVLADVPILYPLKTPENQRFSGGIKWEHWPEMG